MGVLEGIAEMGIGFGSGPEALMNVRTSQSNLETAKMERWLKIITDMNFSPELRLSAAQSLVGNKPFTSLANMSGKTDLLDPYALMTQIEQAKTEMRLKQNDPLYQARLQSEYARRGYWTNRGNQPRTEGSIDASGELTRYSINPSGGRTNYFEVKQPLTPTERSAISKEHRESGKRIDQELNKNSPGAIAERKHYDYLGSLLGLTSPYPALDVFGNPIPYESMLNPAQSDASGNISRTSIPRYQIRGKAPATRGIDWSGITETAEEFLNPPQETLPIGPGEAPEAMYEQNEQGTIIVSYDGGLTWQIAR